MFSIIFALGMLQTQLLEIQAEIPHMEPTIAQVETKWDKDTIRQYIEKQAIENGVDTKMALHVAKNESGYGQYQVGDGHLTCKKTGKPIRSRGVWQINDCAHPTVTDEQAFDVVWSTNWTMQEMKKNGCRIWSTCPLKKE